VQPDADPRNSAQQDQAEDDRQEVQLVEERRGKRGQDRYLERFEEIRAIQEFIVQRARERDVAVIENGDPERSIVEVMELVFSSVGEGQSVSAG